MQLEFSETGPGVGIPYERCERSDGINHGYFDLKRSPEHIRSIPEVQAHPELYRFIQRANREESVFRTAGCNLRISAENGAVVCTSLIHLIFEILHWNKSPRCYRTLFEELKTWMQRHGQQTPETSMRLSLGPTSFRDHGFDGCSLRVYVEGRGAGNEQARANWHRGLLSLSAFLGEFSAAHQRQLLNCSRRVS